MDFVINGSNMSYTGEVSGISSGKQYNITTEGKIGDTVATSSMIMDMDSGIYAYSYTTPEGETVWYKMDINAVMAALGVDMNTINELTKLSDNTADYPTSFAMTVNAMSNSFNVATYDSLCMSADIVKKFFGNDAFTARTNSDGTVLFTSTITDPASIISVPGLSGILEDLSSKYDISASMSVLQNPDGTAVSSGFDMSVKSKTSDSPLGSIVFSMTMTSSDFNMDFSMQIGSFETKGNMKFTFTETSKSVDTSLPAGANPTDITDLMKLFFGYANNPDALKGIFNAA